MLLVAALLLLRAQAPTPAPSLTGTWNAWLDSPGGKLAFVLDFTTDADGAHAYLVNGSGRTEASRFALDRDAVTLWFDPYDSHFDARLTTPTQLDGQWAKRTGPKQWTVMPFHARSPFENSGTYSKQVYGRWSVQFEKSSERAVAVIEERLVPHPRYKSLELPRGVNATFLTTLGDYRYLIGSMATDGSHLELSCFDGAHAFLFKAELKPNGTLEGDFWSGDTWHETWTAVRDDNANLPDPFELTKWNGKRSLASISFPSLDGHEWSLDMMPGKAKLIVAFGSWCPNCNDEAEFLHELDEKYHSRGLSIVGLAFELTGDFARDAKQVQIYADRHKLSFPLLIAGTSDKEAASKAFPLLDKIRAYPTTIFLHADGRVRAVHQGYSGPATGAEHAKLREDFERLIDELLAESDKKK
jgi:thiol-disulfide isomerase/thioredoxin